MICFKCGNKNDDKALFCIGCGYKFANLNAPGLPLGEAGPLQSDSGFIQRFKDTIAERYKIDSEIGRGGMAVVFLAEDLRLERKVALKLLPPEMCLDKSFTERFTAEVKISAKLAHPNIVKIHDVDKIGDFYYYSMSYVEGKSLADILARFGQLYSKIIVRFSFFISNALAHAHSFGIVHRDIKPENVIIDNFMQPVVLDFGIAKALKGTNISQTGFIIGTPLYMSPEQASGGEIDCRADIYSLGCLMYHMATGVPPFQGEDPASILYRHMNEMPVPPNKCSEGIPDWLSFVIMKAMAKNPSDRPQTANDLSKILYKFFISKPSLQKNEITPSSKPVSLTPPLSVSGNHGKTNIIEKGGYNKSPVASYTSLPAQKKNPEIDPVNLTSSFVSSIKDKFLYAIPTAASILGQVVNAINNPESTVDDIAKIIENDPPITVKLINIVNSAHYGSAVKIKSLKKAVVTLGFNMVKEIISTVTMVHLLFNSKTSTNIDYAGIWLHSVGTAKAAELTANSINYQNPDEAYTTGLLHDIGKLIMIFSLPELYGVALNLAKEKNIPIIDAERRIINIDHSIVSKIMLDEWKMPAEISNVIYMHHFPPEESSERTVLVSIISIADILCRKAGIGFAGDLIIPEFHPADLNILGKNEKEQSEKLESLLVTLKSEKENLEMFFSNLKKL